MKKGLFFLLMLGSVFSLSGQSAEKEREIVRLLELMNARSQARQIFDMIVPQIQALSPQIPEEFWERFLNVIDFDSFVMAYVPIYDRHFSLEEIRGLVAFYESPLGKKLLDATPRIMEEAMPIGQEWGRRLGEKVVEEMLRNGYERR